tara:strand:- start:352 stop:585 length:234 start_codon:yes stop_codon:yes gene_type:complete
MYRPKIKCKDGFTMSVQDSEHHYAIPGETSEVGFPSEVEELLMLFVEDPEFPTETVYAHVPNELIDKIIEKHGGLDE